VRLTHYSNAAITRIQATLLVTVIVVAVAAGGLFYYYSILKPQRPFITFATWGGAYTDAFNSTIASFEKEYGVDVHIYTQAASKETVAKVRAEKGSPSIDLFYGGADAGILGADEGLFVDLTEGMVPNLGQIDEKQLIKNYPSVVPYDILAHGWYTRPDLIPSDFQFNGTWQWFFDPRLKGKIAVPTPMITVFIEWASIVAGDYYNYQAGFELIKKLAPNIKVVYSSTPEVEGLLARGEVWVANGMYADAMDLHSKGTPVQTLKFYPLITVPDSMMVVKGGKEDLAMKFLNYILDPNRQATICNYMGVTPTNKNSPPPPAELEPFSATPLSLAYPEDIVFLAAHYDEWIELWNREITPLLP